MVAMAVQTELSEAYGQAGAGKDLAGVKWENADTKGKEHIDSIKNLAEVVDLTTTTFKATASKDGALKTVSYNDGVYTCAYDASKKTYTTTKSTDKLDNTVTIEVKRASEMKVPPPPVVGFFCCRLPYYTRRSAAGRFVGSGLDRSAGRQKIASLPYCVCRGDHWSPAHLPPQRIFRDGFLARQTGTGEQCSPLQAFFGSSAEGSRPLPTEQKEKSASKETCPGEINPAPAHKRQS